MKTMRLMVLVGTMLLCTTSCAPSAEAIPGDDVIALEGATLIDGAGGEPITDAAIVLAAGRVLRVGVVGDFTYSDAAEVVDLRGRWVLPGFVEMHAHLPRSVEARGDTLAQYLRHGVTTVVDLGAPDAGLALKDHEFPGPTPHVYSAGRIINGPGWLSGADLFAMVTSEEEVRAEVRRSVAAGADVIKVYAHLRADLLCTAIDEAHGLGVKVAGHLGVTSWLEAARCGIDMIVHSGIGGPTWELVPGAHRDRFRENILTPVAGLAEYDPSLFAEWRELVDLSDPLFEELVTTLREAGVVVDPNLVVIESIVFSDEPATAQRLSPGAEVVFGPHRASATWDDRDFDEVQATWPDFLDMVRRFHEAGVPLTAGTDLVNQWITAGPAYHRELELLVSAGIPPLEVISIATKNPAAFLGVAAEVGGVFEGGVADLVVLAADPLADISNTRAIEAVYRGGVHVQR